MRPKSQRPPTGPKIDGEAWLEANGSTRVGQTKCRNEEEPDPEMTSHQSVGDGLESGAPSAHNITEWLGELKVADDDRVSEAQRKLVETCWERLKRIARRRLGLIRDAAEDEEDAALSALNSFFHGAADQQFTQLETRDDLWRVLRTITLRKAHRQLERRMAQKRRRPPAGRDAERQPVADENDPQLEVEWQETLDYCIEKLENEELEKIVRLKLQGYRNKDIAKQLDVSDRTVERRLVVIRRIWSEEFADASTMESPSH